MNAATCVNNYLNGNLKDAKRQAKRISYDKLMDYLVSELGWSNQKAMVTANYLKFPSPTTWEAACMVK